MDLFPVVQSARAARPNRLAVVKSSPVADAVTVRFEGDGADSGGGFVVVDGLSVSINDRVVMIPVGSTYVVGFKLP